MSMLHGPEEAFHGGFSQLKTMLPNSNKTPKEDVHPGPIFR